MKILVLFLLLSGYSFCYSQVYSLKDFEECEVPKINSKEWFVFYHLTDKEFVFSLDLGKIQISKSKYVPYTQCDTKCGRLIGVNMGEFGGGLYYKPTDSTKAFFVNGENGRDIYPDWLRDLMMPERNPISKIVKNCNLLQSGNVQSIFTFNDSIYFLGGLAHLGLNFGSLFTLKCSADSFLISTVLELDEAPAAMSIHRDFIYLATSKGFYIIDKNLNKKTIFDNLFWYGLYPTSVVVLDGQNVFVTIRGGYVKINPQEKKLKLYKAR